MNAGCYLISRDQFMNFAAPRSFSFETDYLPVTLPSAAFALFLTNGLFIDIGVPEDYALAQHLLGDRAIQETRNFDF